MDKLKIGLVDYEKQIVIEFSRGGNEYGLY